MRNEPNPKSIYYSLGALKGWIDDWYGEAVELGFIYPPY
jgi:hypothetical protein